MRPPTSTLLRVARRLLSVSAIAGCTAARTAAAQGAADAPATSRFTLHGYLTQAWAASTGTKFYGITGEPSTDFRYAAVQARFAASANDLFLVQLNHRRLGDSPITTFESDINLNWAFYQHAFDKGTTLKVGRVAIPRGIYNELRSVGIALPTYRPPVVLYDEGAYFSETIDGLVASHTFFAERPFRLETHLYAGGWRSLIYDTWSEQYSVTRARAENAIGTQLWLETPVDGARIGVAAQSYRYHYDDDTHQPMKEYQLSVDVSRARGFVRSEALLQRYVEDDFYSGYLQLGVNATTRLAVVAEFQRSRDTKVSYGDGTLPDNFMWHRSDGVGFTWSFSPNFMLKAEHHWDRGIQIEQPGDPRWPPRFRYAIIGLSAGF